MSRRHKSNPLDVGAVRPLGSSKRLDDVPGVGAVLVTALVTKSLIRRLSDQDETSRPGSFSPSKEDGIHALISAYFGRSTDALLEITAGGDVSLAIKTG
jgi:hypothetical protein